MHFQISISSPSRPSLLSLSSSFFYSTNPIFGSSKSPRHSHALQSCRGRKFPVVCSISKVHNYGTVDYERRPFLKWSALYRRISLRQDPRMRTSDILEGWEAEGRRLIKWDLFRVVKELRKYRRFRFALEVYEWMANQPKKYAFFSSDAGVKLDLIFKVHGISSAERYFSNLPDVLKDKRSYGALLNAYARAKMKDKAEALLGEMQDRGYMTETLSYNVMMSLYMNTKEYEKVISTVTEMKNCGMQLDVVSYNIWITACAAMGDIEKMEQVVQRMILDKSVITNWTTYSTLAGIYVKRGDFEKAEKYMMDVELRITGRDRGPFHHLLSLYSSIGKKDKVYRIWNFYKTTFPRMLNLGYHAMLTCLIRLDDIEGAERIYKEWLSVKTSNDPRIFNVLIGWYSRKGMLQKAQIFLDCLLESGGSPNRNTWEIMADGYVREKQISKAVSCLKEAASIRKRFPWRPRHSSVKAFLDLCEELGDIASRGIVAELLAKAGCPDIEAYVSPSNSTVGSSTAVDDSDLHLQGDDSDCDDDDDDDDDSVAQMLLAQHNVSL